jgi:hypothetical protein
MVGRRKEVVQECLKVFVGPRRWSSASATSCTSEVALLNEAGSDFNLDHRNPEHHTKVPCDGEHAEDAPGSLAPIVATVHISEAI